MANSSKRAQDFREENGWNKKKLKVILSSHWKKNLPRKEFAASRVCLLRSSFCQMLSKPFSGEQRRDSFCDQLLPSKAACLEEMHIWAQHSPTCLIFNLEHTSLQPSLHTNPIISTYPYFYFLLYNWKVEKMLNFGTTRSALWQKWSKKASWKINTRRLKSFLSTLDPAWMALFPVRFHGTIRGSRQQSTYTHWKPQSTCVLHGAQAHFLRLILPNPPMKGQREVCAPPMIYVPFTNVWLWVVP